MMHPSLPTCNCPARSGISSACAFGCDSAVSKNSRANQPCKPHLHYHISDYCNAPTAPHQQKSHFTTSVLAVNLISTRTSALIDVPKVNVRGCYFQVPARVSRLDARNNSLRLLPLPDSHDPWSVSLRRVLTPCNLQRSPCMESFAGHNSSRESVGR